MTPRKQLQETARIVQKHQSDISNHLYDIQLYEGVVPTDMLIAANSAIAKTTLVTSDAKKLLSEFVSIQKEEPVIVGLLKNIINGTEKLCKELMTEISTHKASLFNDGPVIETEQKVTSGTSTLNKRGRGKPAGSTKTDARRFDMKIRWKESEVQSIRAAAEASGEDVSGFIRAAALNRARDYNILPE